MHCHCYVTSRGCLLEIFPKFKFAPAKLLVENVRTHRGIGAVFVLSPIQRKFRIPIRTAVSVRLRTRMEGRLFRIRISAISLLLSLAPSSSTSLTTLFPDDDPTSASLALPSSRRSTTAATCGFFVCASPRVAVVFTTRRTNDSDCDSDQMILAPRPQWPLQNVARISKIRNACTGGTQQNNDNPTLT